jgi:diacylglycerol kinase (ATP)
MRRLFTAFQNSRRALGRALRTEAALRQELYLLLVATPLAFIITSDPWRRAELVGLIVLIMAVELLNTAIEKLCDRLHSERHDSIGYVKDLGSAAVLMTILLASFMWVVALWQWLDRVV